MAPTIYFISWLKNYANDELRGFDDGQTNKKLNKQY